MAVRQLDSGTGGYSYRYSYMYAARFDDVALWVYLLAPMHVPLLPLHEGAQRLVPGDHGQVSAAKYVEGVDAELANTVDLRGRGGPDLNVRSHGGAVVVAVA